MTLTVYLLDTESEHGWGGWLVTHGGVPGTYREQRVTVPSIERVALGARVYVEGRRWRAA